MSKRQYAIRRQKAIDEDRLDEFDKEEEEREKRRKEEEEKKKKRRRRRG